MALVEISETLIENRKYWKTCLP